MSESLLPPNAIAQERILEEVVGQGTDLPIPIRDLWKPESCPAELLPWLAWALSVDEWDSDWPDLIKRSVIEQSVAIHRKKGTVHSVRRALEILGVQVELREWFEQKGEPHTFSLTAWAGENYRADGEPLLTPHYYAALQRSVNAVKPVRSHYSFKVGARFCRDLGVAVLMGTSLSLRREFEAKQGSITASMGMISASLIKSLMLARNNIRPVVQGYLSVSAPVAVVTQRTFTLVRVSMEI
ncbi:phage tail protein I [Bathymodiolus platifrons methanotrophic gill symbiont]|uniref:phage tail protein I n=1 Tax=Bathymodiolus platifrons methanotrophic gill symbiont TaxID=113268 RepID=UPI00142DCF42|nr:phage tail protein I [Bathymodiolus platifrons methanotrophic gill symbiont]